MRKMRTQPMQPIIKDNHGVFRFQENKIISMLCDAGQLDLNYIAGQCIEKKIPRVDQMQFWQMLGYSVSGFGDLSFASKDMVAAADEIVTQLQTVIPAKAGTQP
jgi:hypothetical protein